MLRKQESIFLLTKKLYAKQKSSLKMINQMVNYQLVNHFILKLLQRQEFIKKTLTIKWLYVLL